MAWRTGAFLFLMLALLAPAAPAAADDAPPSDWRGFYLGYWTTSGDVNFGGTGTIIPMRYAAEQAHLLVQGSYKFGNP